MTNLDLKKPEVKAGEVLCSGCWAVTHLEDTSWTYTRFVHLNDATLCPKCQITYGEEFKKLMKAGL